MNAKNKMDICIDKTSQKENKTFRFSVVLTVRIIQIDSVASRLVDLTK